MFFVILPRLPDIRNTSLFVLSSIIRSMYFFLAVVPFFAFTHSRGHCIDEVVFTVPSMHLPLQDYWLKEAMAAFCSEVESKSLLMNVEYKTQGQVCY